MCRCIAAKSTTWSAQAIERPRQPMRRCVSGRSEWQRCAGAQVTPEPWGQARSAEVIGLLQQEYARWHVDLGWNLARDWAAVEPARQSGLLPGWISRDHKGRARGW